VSETRYKRYDREFKLSAIRRSFEPGKTVAEVARELDIPVTRLYKWREQLDKNEPKESSAINKVIPSNELETLRRENKRLKQERDILKKSLIFFAREET
jgi:transposase